MLTFILCIWIFYLPLDIFLTSEIDEPMLSKSQPFSLQCFDSDFDIKDNTKDIHELRLERFNNLTQQYEIVAINTPSLQNNTVADLRWENADTAFTRFGSTHCDEKATRWNKSITDGNKNLTDALCIDTGLYQCVALSMDNTFYISPLSVLGKPKILSYRVFPCETKSRGRCTTLQLMCVVEGPRQMEVRWKYNKDVKVVNKATESKTAVNRTECNITLYTKTLNITIEKKDVQTLPICYVTYNTDECVVTDERKSEFVHDGTMVQNTMLKLNSKLTITCSQKWFHLADYSLSKLVVKTGNTELGQITFSNDSDYTINITDGWDCKRNEIYGNANLILSKAAVICNDSGIYQCKAVFIDRLNSNNSRELARSVVIDVGVEPNTENRPEIIISECHNDSDCCVEKDTLIHMTCSVKSSVETEPELTCSPYEGSLKTQLKLSFQKPTEQHEDRGCHQGKIIHSTKNVSIQTTQKCTCRLSARKSQVVINVSPSYNTNPLLHVSRCLSQENCLVFQHSKVEITCFKNGSKNNPMAMYFITNTNEVPISEFPFAINISYVITNLNTVQPCSIYLHEYRVIIYSLTISSKFKCEQHKWSSEVYVKVIKHRMNKDTLSIFWLTPIILGPISLAIVAGILHVVFLKSTLNAIAVEIAETRKTSAASNVEEYKIIPKGSRSTFADVTWV